MTSLVNLQMSRGTVPAWIEQDMNLPSSVTARVEQPSMPSTVSSTDDPPPTASPGTTPDAPAPAASADASNKGMAQAPDTVQKLVDRGVLLRGEDGSYSVNFAAKDPVIRLLSEMPRWASKVKEANAAPAKAGSPSSELAETSSAPPSATMPANTPTSKPTNTPADTTADTRTNTPTNTAAVPGASDQPGRTQANQAVQTPAPGSEVTPALRQVIDRFNGQMQTLNETLDLVKRAGIRSTDATLAGQLITDYSNALVSWEDLVLQMQAAGLDTLNDPVVRSAKQGFEAAGSSFGGFLLGLKSSDGSADLSRLPRLTPKQVTDLQNVLYRDARVVVKPIDPSGVRTPEFWQGAKQNTELLQQLSGLLNHHEHSRKR